MDRINPPNDGENGRETTTRSRLWSTHHSRRVLNNIWEHHCRREDNYRDRRDRIRGRPNYVGGYEEWKAIQLRLVEEGFEKAIEEIREMYRNSYSSRHNNRYSGENRTRGARDGGEDTKTQEETVAEVEEVDIKTTEGIDTKEKREMAIETIEEISPQAKEDLATTMKMPEPKIIIGRWMDGEVTRKKTTRNPLRSMDS